ncbi:sugar-phosphatase [Limosilactobacillus frumenti DSM 13145]|uniref:Sugar-phosphatase n=1 Tax=Limosilactobacillus frumenti DSM 13145 TaxID=1423746 RepID=A0A0R1PC44_9LACO|nr:HAD family hydrolase [Limosilactobacillus frumenti]KRL27114.1 sugar-phosphatase [Limosilactobacillus frumenti DSM 13145]MBA2913803.1 HAD family phosphatase [Limosilactobacillus frumenti]
MLKAPQQFIAIDIDGTLYDDHDHYNIQRFNHDLQALTNKNIQLIVATGNSYDAVQHIFRNSPDVDTFVAENGGRIIVNGQTVMAAVHQRAILQQLLTFISDHQLTPDLLSLSGATATHIAERFRDVPVPFYPHHNYFTSLSEINEPIYNLNINWFKQRPTLDRVLAVADNINKSFAGQVKATYSGAYGIDILPANVNKARGLNQLISRFYHQSLQNVTAFGDSSNDLEMIKEVGTGVAMLNATADLKLVAQRITKFDNNHDGLLQEIEDMYLN